MEETSQQESKSIQQSEHSLLSYKIQQIQGYYSSIRLIQSLQLQKNDDSSEMPSLGELLIPLFTMTSSFNFTRTENDELDSKTVKFLSRGQSRPFLNDTQSTNRQKQKTAKIKIKNKQNRSEKEKKQEKAIKFLKIIKRDHLRDQLLFEQRIFTIKDINEIGYILLSDGRIMQGDFVNGTPVGNLRIKFENGIVYYGPVYNYRPHGVGEMVMLNGEKYLGEFCYGEPHGEGVHYYADGKVKREGEWKRGKYVK